MTYCWTGDIKSFTHLWSLIFFLLVFLLLLVAWGATAKTDHMLHLLDNSQPHSARQLLDDRLNLNPTKHLWILDSGYSTEAQYSHRLEQSHCFNFHWPFHLVFDTLHTPIKHTMTHYIHPFLPSKEKKEWFTHQGLIVFSHFGRVVTYQVCLVSWHFYTQKGCWPHDGSWTKIWMYTPKC